MGVLLSVRAECEVGERHLVWAVVPAGALPCLIDAVRVLRELVRAGAALDPARRVLRGPVEGRLDIPSDDQGRAVADGPGTDLLLEVAFAVPDPVDLLAGRVEPPTAVLHVEVGSCSRHRARRRRYRGRRGRLRPAHRGSGTAWPARPRSRGWGRG